MPGILLAITTVAAACSPTASPMPSPSRSASDVSVVNGVVVGCVSFEQVECEAVALVVLANVPAAAGRPFSVLLVLFSCQNAGNCPKSLAARGGEATVEFGGGQAPLQYALQGPPNVPAVSPIDAQWSGALLPASARVVGLGPFPFRLGHCGLLWEVDFDGSFWVPVGQIDGDASDAINEGSGSIRLVGADLAVFMGDDGFTAGLQRFPGPKQFWLCG